MTSVVKFQKVDTRKIYTIEDNKSKLFTLQIIKPDNKSLTKTTVVSFDKKTDAHNFACILETHKMWTKEYPDTIFNEDSILSLYGDIHTKTVLDTLIIGNWGIDELRMYCLNNLMDILYVKKFEKTTNSKYNIKGELIRIESNIEFYVNLLNTMYDK